MSFDEVPESTRLRAISHPLRLRILELLATSGPLTATDVGERFDSSPSNCSFHLRMLHRAGFIEEVTDATGRNRPWRLAESASNVEVRVDDLDESARQELRQVVFANAERHRRNALSWLDTRDQHPERVRAAAGVRDSVVQLTPDELTVINDAIADLMVPFENRSEADTPNDAIPVAVTIALFPIAAPPAHGS